MTAFSEAAEKQHQILRATAKQQLYPLREESQIVHVLDDLNRQTAIQQVLDDCASGVRLQGCCYYQLKIQINILYKKIKE